MVQNNALKNPLVWVLSVSVIGFLIYSGSLIFRKSKAPTPQNASTLFQGSGEKIAVIELKGVILDSKKMLRQLKAAQEDDQVKGVVLRLNSPGGAVAPSQEIYSAVKSYPKPIIASMASVAASGAYYIAAGVKTIFANPGTLTGSIGVIMEFANLRKLYEWAKVDRYSVKTGKFKDSGAEYRDMSAEEKAYFQQLVENTLGQFKKAVADGRGLDDDAVTAVADGRVFTGEQALELKLVDQLGTLDDAVSFLGKQVGIKGRPQVVYPRKRMPSLIDVLMGGDAEDEESDFEEDSESRTLSGRLESMGVRLVQKSFGLPEVAQVLPAGIYWLWNGAR